MRDMHASWWTCKDLCRQAAACGGKFEISVFEVHIFQNTSFKVNGVLYKI